MSFQNDGRYAAPLLPPEEGLPNCRIRITVTMIPAGPSTRRMTAANERHDQDDQREDRPDDPERRRRESFEPVGDDQVDGERRSRSRSRRARAPRQRPDAEPTAVVSSAARHVATDEERA